MNRRRRIPASTLVAADLPCKPGVYAWYFDGRAVYVGTVKNLHGRIWKRHMGRGVVMTSSAYRRNVAEDLGIATAADIKARRYMPTALDVDSVNTWIRRCSVAWIACRTEGDASDLEKRMKREWTPRLTKI
jgi:hypothetical protein